jgi:uncharacterized protein (DUF2384 family)
MFTVFDAAFDAPLTPAPTPQTFSQEADRKRLSGVAIKAFKRVVEAWRLPNADAAALLGVSASTWDRIKKGSRTETLSQDQLTRASAVIGLYKGLELLFADDKARRWPMQKNRGPLFAGATPIEAMIVGGIPMMLDVRRYIDAVRGGL